ncbi:glutathione-S-transferase theta, GST, putative [Talaromyces stipitatus ATCC 10500]|uniref:Glutathione-S-transferase theta, GST, putative n=1 Tax=Talaromyces stipitatus (strain ATCC 10500 / CBS 375.48 / QM 6759 / NRRL 1006) TaxID=441959 RepID=B8MVE4_TALSN|nr:glutathione-S-transferase theta, GST, putative [Talaromyces stipitatus ATCC 10500]EED11453.1 glutathione-S-transferase theta, GST, putative [Talaromyces stipitatus ATCC 10500]
MSVVAAESRGFIDFYTKSGSTNGAKIAIILNELSLTYRLHKVDKAPKDTEAYRAISPNSHFPVVVDIHPDGFKVSLDQTGAIAQYLINEYDQDHTISFPKRSPEEIEATNWFFFGASRVAPSHDEAVHYKKEAPETIPYSIDRFQNKTLGLFFALEQRLEKTGDYLVGHKFSIADIAQIPFVVAAEEAGINIERFPYLTSWYEKVLSRQGVKKGLSVAGIEFSA